METAIQILLPDGDPNGVRIVKIAGRIIKAFVVPRSHVKNLKDFPEANQPAVYFLFGEGEEENSVYIGQTDNFLRRIKQQVGDKDFWNIALVFTGESEIDAQYLERVCVEAARKASRYIIKNSTGTPGRNISDFQRVGQKDFFAAIQIVSAVLGFPLFEDLQQQVKKGDVYVFELEHALGKGTLLDTQEFIVYKGSTARVREVASLRRGVSALRRQLIEEGILGIFDEHSYIFAQDYIFSSPSTASDVVGGHSRNGWIVWKDAKGKTLDENLRK